MGARIVKADVLDGSGNEDRREYVREVIYVRQPRYELCRIAPKILESRELTEEERRYWTLVQRACLRE